MVETEIAGKIVKDDGSYYTMDFSAEQIGRGMNENLARKRVKKSDCIKGSQ